MLSIRAWVNDPSNEVFAMDIVNQGATDKGGDERNYSVTAMKNGGVGGFSLKHNRREGAIVLARKALEELETK